MLLHTCFDYSSLIQFSLLPKICYTYLTMVKFGTFMPYLKEILEIYKVHDTIMSSDEISIFHQKLTVFAISRNTDKT